MIGLTQFVGSLPARRAQQPAADRGVIPFPVIDDRRRFRSGVHIVERPMPATPQDINELRSLLAWAKASNAPREAKERILADGLARAIAYLDEPDRRRNVVGFVLSALHQSMRRVNDRLWVVVDRDLQAWALEQIEQLFGGPYNPDQPPTEAP